MADDDLVLRCPRHPTYDGSDAPPPMASHAQRCAACDRLREIAKLHLEADCEPDGLHRQILRARADLLSWPSWKRQLIRKRIAESPD